MFKKYLLGIILLNATVINLYADETSSIISMAKFITNLKISGDVRLRQENFWRSTNKASNPDRSRQRFRFRLGLQPEMQDFTVGFRMASGTGEQVSTNQTFDNLGSQKQIWIDQAYIQWKAFEWLKLIGGKMSIPAWTIYSSDIVWDPDLSPEGFSEQLEYKLHERLGVFGNFSQLVLKETSLDTRDPWMYTFQIGATVKLLDQTKLTLAGNYIKNQFENITSLGPVAVQRGDTRFPGTSISTVAGNYQMYHLTADLATKVGSFPLEFQGDYVINNGDLSQLSTLRGFNSLEQRDIAGYQVGAILNQAKAAKSWEVAYFYKYAEFNSTLADLSDSDFGDGGLNRKGHIMWVAYAPRDFVQIKAKLFVTETLHSQLSPGEDSINRMQIDMSVRF